MGLSVTCRASVSPEGDTASFLGPLRTYSVAPDWLDRAWMQERTVALYLGTSFLDASWPLRKKRKVLLRALAERTGEAAILGHTMLVNRAFWSGDDTELRAIQAHEATHHAWERSWQDPAQPAAWPIERIERILAPRIRALAPALRLHRYQRAGLAEEIVACAIEDGWRAHNAANAELAPPLREVMETAIIPGIGAERLERFYDYIDRLSPAHDLDASV